MSSDRTILLKDSQNSVRRWRRLHWVSAVNRARSLAPSCRRTLLSPPPHATCLASHRSRLSSSPREPAHACDVFGCCNECGRVSFAASDQISHTLYTAQHSTVHEAAYQCLRPRYEGDSTGPPEVLSIYLSFIFLPLSQLRLVLASLSAVEGVE